MSPRRRQESDAAERIGASSSYPRCVIRNARDSDIAILGHSLMSNYSQTVNRASFRAQGDVRAGATAASLPSELNRHLHPSARGRRLSVLVSFHATLADHSTALLQAAVNATTLALISAGLPLSDYVCALSLASYPQIPPLAPPQIAPFTLMSPPVPFSNASPLSPAGSGSGSTILLDLCSAEETALPCLTVAVLPRSGKVTLVSLETRVGVGRFEEMLRWGVEGGKVVQGAMEDVSSPSRPLAVADRFVHRRYGIGQIRFRPRPRIWQRCSRGSEGPNPRAWTTWRSSSMQ